MDPQCDMQCFPPRRCGPFCEAAESVARRTYQRGLSAGFFVDNDENRKRLALMSLYGWFEDHTSSLWKKSRSRSGVENNWGTPSI